MLIWPHGSLQPAKLTEQSKRKQVSFWQISELNWLVMVQEKTQCKERKSQMFLCQQPATSLAKCSSWAAHRFFSPCPSQGYWATTCEFNPSCTRSRVLVNASQLLHSVIINLCSSQADPHCCLWMRCWSWVNMTAWHWERPSCFFSLYWTVQHCGPHHTPPGVCHTVKNTDSACSPGTMQFALPARLHWLIILLRKERDISCKGEWWKWDQLILEAETLNWNATLTTFFWASCPFLWQRW